METVKQEFNSFAGGVHGRAPEQAPRGMHMPVARSLAAAERAPDKTLAGLYGGRVVKVAGEDHRLLESDAYRAAITSN